MQAGCGVGPECSGAFGLAMDAFVWKYFEDVICMSLIHVRSLAGMFFWVFV